MVEKTEAFIMVTGGRDAKDYNQVARQLGIAIKDLSDKGYRKITVMHGGATGADSMAHEFCNKIETSLASRGIDLSTKPYYPNYNRYGSPAAQHVRNQTMVNQLDSSRDIMLAFPTPASRGTWAAVKYAKSKGISPRIYKEF